MVRTLISIAYQGIHMVCLAKLMVVGERKLCLPRLYASLSDIAYTAIGQS